MSDGTLSAKILILLMVVLFGGACVAGIFQLRKAERKPTPKALSDPFHVPAETTAAQADH